MLQMVSFFLLSGFLAFMYENGNIIQRIANTLVAGNLFLQLFLSASLNMIWSLLNTLQIIVSLPLLNINFPQNAFIVCWILSKVANFNAINTD